MARVVAAGEGALGPSASEPGRRELEEARDALLRSIEDLDAERDAGDLAASDHEALRARYTRRAAQVVRALDALVDAETRGPIRPGAAVVSDSETSPAPSPKHRRRWLVYGALASFAVAAVVLVAAELAIRLPGQSSSGSVSLGQTQLLQRTLAQAQSLEASGDGAGALTLYEQVLGKDPVQEQALAEAGWLEFQAGVQAKDGNLLSVGQRTEQTAESVQPSAFAPHLYLGSMLLAENEPSKAADEFGLFLADSPPAGEVQRAWPFVLRAYKGAGRTPPPAPAGG